MHVEVTRITETEGPVLRRLYPLYLHDLSEVGGDYYLNEEGSWQPDHLIEYWFKERAETQRLLMRADGKLAGFALVGQRPFPYMTPGRDFRLVEFFILRPFRHRGVGRVAATALFDTLQGTWEVSQVSTNRSAIQFWRSVIAEYTEGVFEEGVQDGQPIQVFKSPGRSPVQADR